MPPLTSAHLPASAPARPPHAAEALVAPKALTRSQRIQALKQGGRHTPAAAWPLPPAPAMPTPDDDTLLAEVVQAAAARTGRPMRHSRPVPDCPAKAADTSNAAGPVAPANRPKLADIAAVRSVPDADRHTSNSGPLHRTIAGVPWTRQYTCISLTLALLFCGLVYWFDPDRITDDTRMLMEQADMLAMRVDSNDGRDAAQSFALLMGERWDPEIFFRCVHPDFWRRAGGRSENAEVQRITTGFQAIQEKIGPLNVANGRAGRVEIQMVRTSDGRSLLAHQVRLHAEFKDNTARKITVTLVRSARRPDRWVLWDFSLPPFTA